MQNLKLQFETAVVCLLTMATSAWGADPSAVVAVGQPPFQANGFTVADERFRFETGEQTTAVAMRDLVKWGALATPRTGTQVLLADGGLLVADIVRSDAERLIVDSYLFGEVALPLENITGILLSPPADAGRRDQLEFRLRDAEGDDDRLILENGDELTGTIVSLGDAEIELESNVGKVKIELARVAAVVFNPTLRAAAPVRGQRVITGMADGGWLVARRLASSDAKLELHTGAGPTLQTKADRVVFLQTLGGRATYLSDLKPSGYRHVPFLALAWPWKADRNVIGTHLRAGGKLYLKGLGMHSASRLSFPLDGSHRRFEAELAIDDHTAGGGSVLFRIYLDTEQVYASPVIRGGEDPTPVSIDLPQTARSLSLIVDYAERGDEQDHANWLNARLVE